MIQRGELKTTYRSKGMSHPRMDFKSLPCKIKERLKTNCGNKSVKFTPCDYQFFLNKHRMGEANEMIDRIQRDKAIDDPSMHKYRDTEFDME